jgi:amidase
MASKATIDDVHSVASHVGVKMADDEAEAYHQMLTATESAFSRLLAMPDYHLPVDIATYPRTNMHKPTAAENVLGVAWAHTFSPNPPIPPASLWARRSA